MKTKIIVLLLVYATTFSQSNISKIDSLLTYYNVNHKMMGQYAINANNSTLLETAYSSKANPVVNLNNQSAFKIGSVTKMFTATIILQLAEEKKLKLTDHLSKYYPNAPMTNSITIEMLLRHRSGFAEYENHVSTTNQIADWLEKSEIIFEPNATTKFTNTNYFVLGKIIEKVTNKSYQENLVNRICKPLQLQNTYLINSTNNTIQSYVYKNNAWQPINETNILLVDAANGVASTAKDLNTFMQSLFNNKLIKPESLSAMTKTQNGFGLGITVIPFGDRVFYGHAGRINGNQAIAWYYPQDKLAYAALNNTENTNTNEINFSVLSIYYNQPFSFPDFTDLHIDESVLKKYEGIYKSKNLPIEIKVFIEGGKLFAQTPGQSPFPLAAKSETEFDFHPARIKISFKNNEFTLNQSDANYLFTKQ